MRIGLVGIGDAGKHHARALLSGGHPWSAVVARDAGRLAAFRTELDVPVAIPTFPTLDALLDARACDAVILGTPDGVHAAQVVAAVARGVHVLVEKPLALSAADGQRAIAAARQSGVHLAVGYHLRHHAAHGLMLARAAELVGRVRTVHVRWAWPDPATRGWRARGDGARFWSLAALGTHAIDLALWFAGAGDVDVAALTLPAHGIDQQAEVSLRMGEVLAHISVSVVHRAVSRLVVSGDAGELEALGTLGARGDGSLVHRAGRTTTPIPFEVANPYGAQLRAFVDSAAAGFSDDPAMMANLDILDRIKLGGTA